jgi:signal transduction histidine kinase
MVMDQKPAFRTRARVIKQLGEQLIKNESIALLELIKNAYDADASFCEVVMFRPNQKNKGRIRIHDDGEGMDYDTLCNVWLEIGTSNRVDLRNKKVSKRSHKFNRMRLGEKGIGRLGAHRLGKQIEIITRKKGKKECVLEIDWNQIENSRYVEDLPVKVWEREPEEFEEATGTMITIHGLRVNWTKGMARTCARSVTSLNSPFDSDDKFRVSFRIFRSSWLDGILTYKDIEEYKLFEFDITMSGNEITKFKYEFTPWDTMNKLKYRPVTHEDGRMKKLLKMVYREKGKKKDIDLGYYEIGEVRFRGVIFDRDTRTLALGVQDKLGLTGYLNRNGGARVFRDNMRVFDYGEEGNDWLDLDGRRVNFPTKRISNNIILSAVYLHRDDSDDLEEKTNREGFVENAAYWEFWRAIRFAMDRVESLRKTDKDLLRKHYGPKIVSQPVVTSIAELQEVVESDVKDIEIKRKINRYLSRIENEYEYITDSLLRSAGAGLNLVVVIHQMQKIVKDIKAMLRKKVSSDIIEERIRSLSSLIEGYSILVRKSDKKTRSLKGITEQGIFNVEFRLESHGIGLEAAYRERSIRMEALCSEDHVLNALMNLFDNSIWWLDYAETQNPSIFLDISDDLPGYMSIIFADNGPGFTMPVDEAIKPFVSDKPDGMGIGLHLSHQIMESLGGKLLFPEPDLFDIPGKYEKGAIIALAFKKGDH